MVITGTGMAREDIGSRQQRKHKASTGVPRLTLARVILSRGRGRDFQTQLAHLATAATAGLCAMAAARLYRDTPNATHPSGFGL
jgi:electron transfer flavoprotein alpha subunit